MKYQIYNFRKQCFIGKTYECRKKARRRADKLDLEYGAISFRVMEVTE